MDETHGITLHPDGSATVEGVRLRAPSLSEYGDVIDAFERARLRIVELGEQADQYRADAVVPGADRVGLVGEAVRVERERRETFARLVAEVLRPLTGDPDAWSGGLPAWMGRPDGLLLLLNHWETVPFRGSEQIVGG